MSIPDDFYDVDPADYPALCCDHCGGTGEVTDDYDMDSTTCPECDGTGWLEGHWEDGWDA